jgi:alkylated DNA repair protein alkB family protein 6
MYNHLLINDYPSGVGIMPHTDGPAYRAKVVVLSIGSYALISFQKNYNSGD